MRYAQIRSLDISNGEGIGVALFTQGCSFHCNNCFNKETWDYNGGQEWTEKIKNQFMELASMPFIKRVSILGGEPLSPQNLSSLYDLLADIKHDFADKTIWLYTGYTWEQIMYPVVADDLNTDMDMINNKRREIVYMCDVVVDGRYIDELKDIKYPWAGSTNQRVIDVKKTLKTDKIILLEE